MRRREYIAASAATVAIAGCLGGSDDDDDEDPENQSTNGNQTDPEDNQSTQPGNETPGEDEEDPEEDEEEDSDAPAYVQEAPEEAIHQWPFTERTGETVGDALGAADGVAAGAIENVEGDWTAGFAEYVPEGEQGHVNLGQLETINMAASEQSLTFFATIEPEAISPDHSMTILGAGGGDANWLEFRLGDSFGGRAGRPTLFIRDTYGNTLQASAQEKLEAGERHRIAIRLDGPSARDVTFWIDGEEADAGLVMNDGLSGAVEPEQSYGLFASNPEDPDTFGTRRWFSGTIDNVIFCNEALSDEDAAAYSEL